MPNNNYEEYVGINKNAVLKLEAQEAAKLEKKNSRSNNGPLNNSVNFSNVSSVNGSSNGRPPNPLARVLENLSSSGASSNNGIAKLNNKFPINSNGNVVNEPEVPNGNNLRRLFGNNASNGASSVSNNNSGAAPWVLSGSEGSESNDFYGGRRSRKSQRKNRKSRKSKKSRKQRKNRKSRKN
jgi:hypothetical protein